MKLTWARTPCSHPGAGRKRKLAFADRLPATLVHLRLGFPHAALAELFDVDRSTISTAIREVRPLLAARGFAVPDRPGLRLRTSEDAFAYAEAVDLRIDGTEVRVRRPTAGRPGHKAFVPGKKKQNTVKTTTFSHHQGRTFPHQVSVPPTKPKDDVYDGGEAGVARTATPAVLSSDLCGAHQR